MEWSAAANFGHNERMRCVFVLALVAGCGVRVGGDTSGTDGSTDTQRPTDAALADARPCTGGDMNTTVAGVCFMLFTATPRTWDDANTACTSIDARLAILDTTAKHTAAKTLAGTFNTWIGLADVTIENTFRWVDANVPFSFTAWDPDEPSNGAGTYEEDCVVIAGARGGDWDDRPCSPAIANAPPGCCTYAYMCQF